MACERGYHQRGVLSGGVCDVKISLSLYKEFGHFNMTLSGRKRERGRTSIVQSVDVRTVVEKNSGQVSLQQVCCVMKGGHPITLFGIDQVFSLSKRCGYFILV